jgi:hypothetical protein
MVLTFSETGNNELGGWAAYNGNMINFRQNNKYTIGAKNIRSKTNPDIFLFEWKIPVILRPVLEKEVRQIDSPIARNKNFIKMLER